MRSRSDGDATGGKRGVDDNWIDAFRPASLLTPHSSRLRDWNFRDQTFGKLAAAKRRIAGHRIQPMARHARQYSLYVLRNDLVAIIHERPGASSIDHRETGARREPVDEIGGLPSVSNEGLHIVEQRRRRKDLPRLRLQIEQFESGECRCQGG